MSGAVQRVDLSRFGVMVQAALSDAFSFDPFTFEQDGLAASEVDVGRGEIVEAFVVIGDGRSAR